MKHIIIHVQGTKYIQYTNIQPYACVHVYLGGCRYQKRKAKVKSKHNMYYILQLH